MEEELHIDHEEERREEQLEKQQRIEEERMKALEAQSLSKTLSDASSQTDNCAHSM